LSAAHDADIASIYAEASGGGTLSRPEAAMYAAGVRRVMASLGMLELEPADIVPADHAPLRLVGNGDLDVPATVAPFDGLCEMLVGTLDIVAGGQVVAIVTDPITGDRAEVRSEGDGVVVLARRGARVARDDNLVVLAQPETSVA
jgi:predicted deacylase